MNKKLIKEILREAIIPKLDEIENNIRNYGGVLGALIWFDDENGDMFYLFVGFTDYEKISEFSYSFMLLDKSGNPKTGYMTKRSEVAKYMPDEIKNKKQIFPIIINMTKKLLNTKLPDKIIRRTIEKLEGSSLSRYEIITDIMINEYGYKLVNSYKDDNGFNIWELIKSTSNNENDDMNERYEIGGIPSFYDNLKRTFDPILPLVAADIKKMNEKLK